jgi:DNA-binding NarL/FixJ family response regulator
MTKTVLIVDDVPDFIFTIIRQVKAVGMQYEIATNGAEAITAVQVCSINAIITDVQMPHKNGIDLLQFLWRTRATIPTYVHSSDATFPYCGTLWDLPHDISKKFGQFASFKRKDGNMETNIRAFLESIRNT